MMEPLDQLDRLEQQESERYALEQCLEASLLGAIENGLDAYAESLREELRKLRSNSSHG